MDLHQHIPIEPRPIHPVPAPEIGPDTAIVALMLLVGLLAVIRARK